MNAETRAKEIYRAIMRAPDFKDAQGFIATALRQAENDKLEEAACAATAAGQLWAKEDRDPTRAGCGTEIAKLIRSLKFEGAP